MADHVSPIQVKVAIAILTIGAAAAAARADDAPPLITDRPDVTESSEVVTRGLFQFEIGYNFVRFDLDGERVDASTLPATLVRIGLDEKVELRLEWLGYVNVSTEQDGITTDESGSGNTALGVKIKLREERGAGPQMALLVDAVMPTGDQGFRTERIDPQVRVAGSNTISDRIGLGWNAGVAALSIEDENGELHTDAIGRYSVAAGIGINERWGTFVEVFGFVPLSGDEPDVHSFDTGFTYLTSKTVQLDMSAGVGLNDEAEDWFVGAGVSFRLPR